MFEATKFAAASAALAVASAALATPDTRPYLSLGGSVIIEDSDRESDTGFGARFGVGKRFNNVLGLELSGFFNDFSGGLADWEDYGVAADALLFVSQHERYAPYLSLGAGVMRSEANANNAGVLIQRLDQRRAFAQVGGGLKVFPDTSPVGFTADYRFRYFDTNVAGIDELGDHILSLGVLFPVGSKAAQVASAAATVVDSDGDGVPDDRDLCPGTPAGVAAIKKSIIPLGDILLVLPSIVTDSSPSLGTTFGLKPLKGLSGSILSKPLKIGSMFSACFLASFWAIS